MPLYFYKAKNLQNQKKEGSLEAFDPGQLAKILHSQGYFLISLKEEEKKSFLSFFKKISPISLREKLFLTKNLSLMISTGVPLPRIFEILIKQIKNEKFKKILNEVSQRIIKGESLSQALSYHPQVFSRIYQETLKVGEETGKMEDSLEILASQMEQEYILKSHLITAMIYPLIIIVLIICIGIVMFLFVVPKLKDIFVEFNLQLPLTTRIMLSFSDLLIKNWFLIILLIFCLVSGFIFIWRKGKERKFLSRIMLEIPIISKIIRNFYSALILRILTSLFSAGVPIVHSLEITSESIANFYFRQSLKEAAQKIKKGQKLSQALLSYERFYSPTILEMIKIGEETGETVKILTELAEFYEKEVNTALQRLSSVIEPCLIVIIGIFVGFFAISMLQPMLAILQAF